MASGLDFTTRNVLNPYKGAQESVASAGDIFSKYMDKGTKAKAAAENQRRFELKNARAEETAQQRRDVLAEEKGKKDFLSTYTPSSAGGGLVDPNASRTYSDYVGEELKALPRTAMPGSTTGSTVPDIGPDTMSKIQSGYDALAPSKEATAAAVYRDVLKATGDSALALQESANRTIGMRSKKELTELSDAAAEGENQKLELASKQARQNYDLRSKQYGQNLAKIKAISSKYSSGNKAPSDRYEVDRQIEELGLSGWFGSLGTDENTAKEYVAKGMMKGLTPAEALTGIKNSIDEKWYGDSLDDATAADFINRVKSNLAKGKVTESLESLLIPTPTAKETAAMNYGIVEPKSYGQIQQGMGERAYARAFGEPAAVQSTPTSTLPEPKVTGKGVAIDDASREQIYSSIMFVESGGDSNAISPKGAKGRMQVMDGTNSNPGNGVEAAKDDSKEERERVGRDYYDAMYKRFGTHDDALRAYNWGPANVDTWKANGRRAEDVPTETRNYVKKVKARLGNYDLPAAGGSTPASEGGMSKEAFAQLDAEYQAGRIPKVQDAAVGQSRAELGGSEQLSASIGDMSTDNLINALISYGDAPNTNVLRGLSDSELKARVRKSSRDQVSKSLATAEAEDSKELLSQNVDDATASIARNFSSPGSSAEYNQELLRLKNLEANRTRDSSNRKDYREALQDELDVANGLIPNSNYEDSVKREGLVMNRKLPEPRMGSTTELNSYGKYLDNPQGSQSMGRENLGLKNTTNELLQSPVLPFGNKPVFGGKSEPERTYDPVVQGLMESVGTNKGAAKELVQRALSSGDKAFQDKVIQALSSNHPELVKEGFGSFYDTSRSELGTTLNAQAEAAAKALNIPLAEAQRMVMENMTEMK